MSGRDVEAIAERIALHALGGVVLQRDDGSRPGMVDFVVDAADGTRVAVEVTTLTRGESVKFHKASAEFGGPAGDLGRTWCVRFLHSTTVKKVAAPLHALLRELEKTGVERADRKGDDPSIVNCLNTLGVIEVYSVDGPGWILAVGREIGALTISGDILRSVATEVTNDPRRNDAPKLKATGLAHRHLFILVSPHAGPTRIEVEEALKGRFLPSAPPTVPEDFTGVWVGVSDLQPAARWTREPAGTSSIRCLNKASTGRRCQSHS